MKPSVVQFTPQLIEIENNKNEILSKIENKNLKSLYLLTAYFCHQVLTILFVKKSFFSLVVILIFYLYKFDTYCFVDIVYHH